jgi:8-oxo-dGTP pyrophosphatase MutT (NUDIX family)
MSILIFEAKSNKLKAAVGIVQDRDRWLLGLSTAKDDRHKKWCFPGGGIDRGESPRNAAKREVLEETGIKCYTVGDMIQTSDKKHVAFFHCKVSSHNQKIILSDEFYAIGWFKASDLRNLDLYPNVRTLINKIK